MDSDHLNFLPIPIFAQWIPSLIGPKIEFYWNVIRTLLLLRTNVNPNSWYYWLDASISCHFLFAVWRPEARRMYHCMAGRTWMQIGIHFLKIWRWITSYYTALARREDKETAVPSLHIKNLTIVSKWFTPTALALSTHCPELINTFQSVFLLTWDWNQEGPQPNTMEVQYTISFLWEVWYFQILLYQSCNCASHLNWLRRGYCLYYCRTSSRGWSFLENSGENPRIKAWYINIFLIPIRSDRRGRSTYLWWTKSWSYTARGGRFLSSLLRPT